MYLIFALMEESFALRPYAAIMTSHFTMILSLGLFELFSGESELGSLLDTKFRKVFLSIDKNTEILEVPWG